MSAFGPIIGLTFAFYGAIFLIFAGYHVLSGRISVGRSASGSWAWRSAESRTVGASGSGAPAFGTSACIISWWAFGIGLLWVGFDPRSQGWHDKIASTFVIRRS